MTIRSGAAAEGRQGCYAGRPAVTPGMGPAWMALNRGKRSVTLDLKLEDDRAVILGLLADADVFVVNVRGKALDHLGLDYARPR